MKPDKAFVVVMTSGLAQERSYMPGHLDPEFHARVTGSVMSVAIQPDGKILIGGVISAVNGQPCANVVRLLSDGATDSGFAARANLPMRRIRMLDAGRILLAGDHFEIKPSDTPRFGVAARRS